MNSTKASPAEMAALVRMVAASAELIIFIGRMIKNGPGPNARTNADAISAEFVDAIIGVQESEEEAARESYR